MKEGTRHKGLTVENATALTEQLGRALTLFGGTDLIAVPRKKPASAAQLKAIAHARDVKNKDMIHRRDKAGPLIPKTKKVRRGGAPGR